MTTALLPPSCPAVHSIIKTLAPIQGLGGLRVHAEDSAKHERSLTTYSPSPLASDGPTRILFCPNPPGPGSFLPREEPGFLEKLRKPGDVGGLPSLIPDHTPAASTGSVPWGPRGQRPSPFGQWTVLPATTALWVPRPPPSTHVPGAPSERGLGHAAPRIVDPVLQDNSALIQVTRAVSLVLCHVSQRAFTCLWANILVA